MRGACPWKPDDGKFANGVRPVDIVRLDDLDAPNDPNDLNAPNAYFLTGAETVIRSLFISKTFCPTPWTFIRSSTAAKGPFCCR